MRLDIAEADGLFGLDQVGGVGVDAVATDKRACGRAQVFHEQPAGLDDEAGVAARDAEVVDDDAVAIGPAHDERGQVDGDLPRLPIGSSYLERTELHAVTSPGAQGTWNHSRGEHSVPGRAAHAILRIR